MKSNDITIKCTVDTTELKAALELVRLLKQEVLELNKLGIKIALKNKKTILPKK